MKDERNEAYRLPVGDCSSSILSQDDESHGSVSFGLLQAPYSTETHELMPEVREGGKHCLTQLG